MKTVPIVKIDEKQRYTLGVVYEPDTLDAHNEFTDAEEIEKAAWGFMGSLQASPKLSKTAVETLKSIVKLVEEGGNQVKIDVTELCEEVKKSGGLNDMHINTIYDDDIGDIVECYLAPCEMRIIKENGDVEVVKKGSWMVGTVWSDEHFKMILDNKRTGYSLEGKCRKEKI